MPRVLCTLPHASTSINGVAFSAVPAGMLSVEDLPDDIAASFASICGYELVTPPPVKPATSPPPAAATVAPNPPAPKAAAAVAKAAPAASKPPQAPSPPQAAAPIPSDGAASVLP